MYATKRRFRSCVIGLAAGLVIAVPVSADDTELYINQAATGVKPNVLFILDTSGSMATEVTTTKPFDPAKTYSGSGSDSCDSSRIFWSDNGTPPDCDTSRWFNATKLRCQAAAGPLGAGGAGQYTDRLARWIAGSTRAWRDLSTGTTNPPHVECQADQGVHGDGTGGTYIKNGSGGPWQSGSSGAANWSSTGDTYTIFSANYLNWFHYHSSTVDGTRIQIMKDVVKSVVDSNTNINIGLMRYDTKNHGTPSTNKGGPVIFPMSDIDAPGIRTSFKAKVDALTASGNTPLSETLYEAYLYLSGQGVFFGKAPNTIVSVPGCLNPSDSSKYKSPMDFECQTNFIVYLTDGEPTHDGDADSKIGTLLSGSTLTDKTCAHGPNYDPADNCLDELAEYLRKADLRSDLNDKQNAVTYTIGFTANFPLLSQAATKGGGKYFTANTSQELSSAFTQIVNDIRKISDLFSAPAVSVNAFNQLYHNSELYFALFQPAENIHWPGNVKRFQIGPYDSDGNGTKDQYAILDAGNKLAVDPNTGFFSKKARSFWRDPAEPPDGGEPELGGAASKQPDPPDTRKVFTYTGDYSPGAQKDLSQPVNRLHESNSSITKAMLGLPALPEPDPEKTLLLQWARGVDVDDEDADSVTAEARKVMGDPLHATPVLVSYGLSGTTEDMTLFVTNNDGFLHAVDTDDGSELFSFVPKEMLARLKTLRADPALSASGRNYGLDGPMTAWIKENAAADDPDRNIEPGEGDHVYLYFGERRGGRNYYAVDVTNRDAPELLWKIEGGVIGGDFEELGETWSAPKHTKVKIGSSEKDVLIFGGGYDEIQEGATVPVVDGQGRAIYMVDAETGVRLWWTGKDTLSPDLGFVEMTNSIPANVRVIDVDRDGLADRMYAADLRGQLWRFDINNGAATASGLVSGALMAQLQKTSASAPANTEADNRRFFNEPDAALIVPPGKPSFMSVSIGSGNRAHPLNLVTKDRFYVVRDPNPLRKPVAYPSAWPLTEADLHDVTALSDVTNAQQQAALNSAIDSKHGWKINLVDITTGSFVGEKVLNEAVTFGGVVLFGTFTPVATQSATSCGPATGTGRIYALNILNGNPVYNLDQVGDDKNLKRSDRSTDLTHAGIPPDIIIFFPKPADGLEGEPTPVVGSEILNDLRFRNPVVKTYWYADEEGMY